MCMARRFDTGLIAHVGASLSDVKLLSAFSPNREILDLTCLHLSFNQFSLRSKRVGTQHEILNLVTLSIVLFLMGIMCRMFSIPS